MKEFTHIKWLFDTGERLNSSDGKEIEIWEFQHQNDSIILSEWATHFRNHYCLDNEIDTLREGTGKTRKKYLLDIKFPDEKKPPGPSIRAGDFAEILIADYLEFFCNYWIPRVRYLDKTIKNESIKGSDIIGFKITKPELFSLDDEMIIFEVKAAFTKSTGNTLQRAVNDSAKDELRISESLNALKQIIIKQMPQYKDKIERFQNKADHPYQEKSGAAAVFEISVLDKSDISTTITTKHYNRDCLSLIVVKGEDMMSLVHNLYRRAADEA